MSLFGKEMMTVNDRAPLLSLIEIDMTGVAVAIMPTDHMNLSMILHLNLQLLCTLSLIEIEWASLLLHYALLILMQLQKMLIDGVPDCNFLSLFYCSDFIITVNRSIL